MNEADRRQVHAEYEGELDPAARADLDARAALDPTLARYRADMQRLRADLRGLDPARKAPPPIDLDALTRSAPPPAQPASGALWWIAAAAAALLAAGVWWGLGGASAPQPAPAITHAPPALGTDTIPPSQPIEAPRPATAETIAFRLAAPAATRVAVAGDFNGWRPDALTMTRTPDGEWLARADLPPGRYAYMYVVDGQWTTPPDAPRTQDDGFGSTNAIIDVL